MSTIDVTRRSAAVAAMDAGAQSFTFVPYFRTGAAAGIRTPFAVALPARATVSVAFDLVDGGVGRESVTQDVVVRGPGDVLGVDPAQVVRRHPVPDTGTAPTGDLVHIEFDQPDLPWMFTPAAPANGVLPPWLRLVVVPAPVTLQPPAGAGLPPSVRLRRSLLPPPEDAWAWAHVQVSGRGLAAPALASHLGSGAPALNVARLVCPTRLEPHTSYRALVVPTFEAGVRAGLGLDALDSLAWSWGAQDTVTLPVYDTWAFATGDEGGFEELARELKGMPASPSIGRRLVDTSRPGSGIDAAAAGGPRSVRGALVAPSPEPDVEGHWDAAATEQLRALLDPSPPGADPEVGPPIYGGAQALCDALPASAVPAAEPRWLAELNLDPAHRIAAALGAAVVRMDQEQLMVGAWSQLQNVREANAVLRAAQFARFASTALHRRTLRAMAPGDVLGVTHRAQAHLSVADVAGAAGLTARGAVAVSALPTAATSAALRRLVRPLGRAVRPLPAAERAHAAIEVLADGDVGADWVLPIPDPRDRDDHDVLGAIERGDLGGVFDVQAGDEAMIALTRIIDELVTVEEIDAFSGMPSDAARLDAIARQVGLGWALVRQSGDWWIPADTLARHRGTGVDPEAEAPPFSADRIVEGVFRPLAEAIAARWDGSFGELPQPEEAVIDRRDLAPLWGEPSSVIGETFNELGVDGLVEPLEPPRPRLDLAALDLVGRLHPWLTVPRRTASRLPGLAAMFGRAGDDITPIAAAPEFTRPLYEALVRLDQEWLMPGVAAIAEPDMVTLLETNSAFVSSFLVGANHEFARELVWREYPTDGRASSLRRFWTTEPDIAPLHTLRRGGVEELGDPARAGKLVFVVRGELVRRFPHLIAAVVASATSGDEPEYGRQPRRTLFRLPLAPDLLLIGVDLTDTQVRDADPASVGVSPARDAYWFTLAEHIGALRFGLDEVFDPTEAGPGGKVERDDLAWLHWAAPGTPHLPARIPEVLERPAGTPVSSALFAWALFQKPARFGIRVKSLLDENGVAL